MSKILDQLKSTADSSGRCHVRVSDSMTYGPVALATVCQWAAQGRVTSDSEISFDREQWVRADLIPELGLDWMALAESMDSFGPFNLQALSQLVRRGIVSPDAQLKHRETGETLDVTTALDRTAEARPLNAAAARLLQISRAPDAGSPSPPSRTVAIGEPESAAATGPSADGASSALVTELRRELAAAQDEGNRLKHRLQVESEGWNELKGELSRAREGLAEVRARHKALQEENDARAIEQGGRIAELTELLAVAREGRVKAESEQETVRQSLSTHSAAVEQKELGLEALRNRVEEVESALAAAHDRGATLESECARLKSDSIARAAALEEAVAQQSALQITLKKRNDEVAFLDQAARQAALKATERITKLQSDLEAKVRAELGDLTQQLTEAREVGAQREMESGLVIDTLKAEMASATAQLAASARRLQELEVENGALRSELDVVRQEAVAQAKQVVGLDKKLANRDEKIKGLNKELKERESALKSAIRKAQDADARVAAMDARARDMEALAATLQAVQSAHDAKVIEHVDLKSRADAEAAKLVSRVAELAKALSQREADLAASAQKLQASDAAVTAARAEAKTSVAAAGATHGAEVEALKVQLDGLKNACGAQAAQIEALVAELAQARTEAAKPPAKPEPPHDWYLRYDDENMLGPVAFDVLVSWAEDCRVAHDHDVSCDRVFWAKAADVAGLGMEWMITLVDGTEYGPINRLAVKDLIADGTAAEEAELRHCRTGATLTARDIKPE